MPGIATYVWMLSVAGALLAIAPPCPAFAADRLILRNLDILTDYTVTALDEDGLVLDRARKSGSNRITWDEVERGAIALDQARFDALLEELGPSLYRIRQRLKIGDYESLAEPAELLYPRFAPRKGQTAYMVCQAVMWSRLALGKRQAAVEPFLRCAELVRGGEARAAGLPGSRRLEINPQTGISPELLPIWFDAQQAKESLPGVQEAIRAMTHPRPEGAYVYYVSLALAAGETAEVGRVLNSIRGEQPATANWRTIVLAQQEIVTSSPGLNVEALRAAAPAMPDGCRPAALYWIGLADAQSLSEPIARDGILALLSLPAEYGRAHPELAAAGLYHAATALDKLKDDSGAVAVRHELSTRYASTDYAARLTSESKSK